VLPLRKLVIPRRFSKIIFHKNDIWQQRDSHWQIHILTELVLSSNSLRARWPKDPCSSPSRSKIFSSPRRPRRLWVAPSLLKRLLGTLSPGVKRPGSEADDFRPTSAEVKNTWIYISTPPDLFMA
jgi:hypothetical protein